MATIAGATTAAAMGGGITGSSIQNKSCNLFSSLTMVGLVVLIVLVQGEQTSTKNPASDVDYDPWKESDRPKVVVDYHRGPLRGKNICSLWLESSDIEAEKLESVLFFLMEGIAFNRAKQG